MEDGAEVYEDGEAYYEEDSDREMSPDAPEHTQGTEDYRVDDDGAIVIDSDDEDGDEADQLQDQRSPDWTVQEGFEEGGEEEEEYMDAEEEEDGAAEDALPGEYALEPQFDEEEADQLIDEDVLSYSVDRGEEFVDLETDVVHGEDDTYPEDDDEDQDVEGEEPEIVEQNDDQPENVQGKARFHILAAMALTLTAADEEGLEITEIPVESSISMPVPDAFHPSYNGELVEDTSLNPYDDLSFTTQDLPPFDPTGASAFQILQHLQQSLPNAPPALTASFNGQSSQGFYDEDAHYLERDGLAPGTCPNCATICHVSTYSRRFRRSDFW